MSKVENIFVLPVAFVLIAWAIVGYSTTNMIDFHVHDTLLVISHAYVAKFLLLLPVLFYILYRIIRKKQGRLVGWITWTHTTITVLCLLFMSYMIFFNNPSNPRRYFDYSAGVSFNRFLFLERLYGFMTLFFLLAQVLFVVYFIVSMVRRSKLSA